MFILSDEFDFPSIESADENGLLAIAGDLHPQRLLNAYRNGIFPWYNEDEPICWWSPDPRCVLFPDDLKVSKTMQTLIRRNAFDYRFNQHFELVIQQCKLIGRKEGNGTWIQDEMIEAYSTLHQMGFAFSAESWKNNTIVGGLYGIKIGNVFFGESMFSIDSNASKFAFIHLVQQWKAEGLVLIDCQMRTDHLVSLGATMISRKYFSELLTQHC